MNPAHKITTTNMNLSKEDSEIYLNIVKHGNMDDMFDFGYACGRVSLAKEQLHKMKKLTDGFAHPKDCPDCPTKTDKQTEV